MNGGSSLRRKITMSYYLFGGVIVILAVSMFMEVHYVEQRFLQGEGVLTFYENTLEARRYEKNFFLYRHPDDYQKNLDHLHEALLLLDENHDLFEHILGPEPLLKLESELYEYQVTLRDFRQFIEDPQHNEARVIELEARIRDMGQQITQVTATLNREERRLVHRSINLSIQSSVVAVLVLAIIAIITGRTLSRHVISSLKMLEQSLGAVAEGNFQMLELPSNERELVSIRRAFNRMLHALDLHEKHRIQSEKLASLGTMLSGMAHELNNPLSNISSSCQILMEEAGDIDTEFQMKLLHQIDDQTMRARNIIRSLLDFSRNKTSDSKPVSLKQLLDETTPLLASQLPSGISLQIQVPDGLVLSANKQRLQQVFVNLIKNSLDAMGDQGAITISADLKTTADGRAIVIRVQDNGPGISPQARERIFDPFFTTKDVGEGAGLGLFVVHEIVKEQGGSIELDNTTLHGVAFIITLPAFVAEEEQDADQNSQQQEPSS